MKEKKFLVGIEGGKVTSMTKEEFGNRIAAMRLMERFKTPKKPHARQNLVRVKERLQGK